MDGMSDHEHFLDQDNHPPTAAEREERSYPLDLAAVRTKLANKQGKQYWRTLEELSEDPHFADLLHREFPRAASEWDESVDRRDFL
jgi:MoCo/4Fe-4S cofactor protein with predicted Tat translocation signal